MGTVLIAAVALVAMNFIVDIAYSLIDPRVRLA
jgi:peptide/nickel transport system permease protein